MKRFLVSLGVILGSLLGAEPISTAVVEGVFLDTTAAQPVVTLAQGVFDVPLAYSTSMWTMASPTGGEVALYVNDEQIFEAEAAEGDYRFMPTKAGGYALRLQVGSCTYRKMVKFTAPTVTIAREGVNQCKLTASDGRSPICYTLDGSDPTATSALYTAPFQISLTQPTQVRASTFAAGALPGEVSTAFFENVWGVVSTAEASCELDTTLDAVVLEGESMALPYDVLWEGDVSSRMRLKVQGETLAERTGAGEVMWTPTQLGRTALSLQTLNAAGTCLTEYTATVRVCPTEVTVMDGTRPLGVQLNDGHAYLSVVRIPGTISTLCANFFEGCERLQEIYFEGEPPAMINPAFPASAQGYYSMQYASAWSAVIATGQWKQLPMSSKTVTVTFDAHGGEGGTTVERLWGEALTAPTVTRTGYTFTGWSSTVPSKVPAKNVTYKAQWKINQYTQKFDANGGSGGKTIKQNYNTALIAPTVTREGYVFTGWSPAVPAKVPAKNATYKAQWKVNSDYLKTSVAKNQVTITGCSRTLIGPLTIPAKIGGKPVVAIAQDAFKGQTKLTRVVIPSGVKSIAYRAFYGCTGLTSVTIPNTVTAIYGRAFEKCTNLKTVTIPASTTTLGGFAFGGCTGIQTLTLPATLKNVAVNSFDKVAPITLTAAKPVGGMLTTKLKTVKIPSGVKSVEYKSFYGCKTMTSLTIPSTVKAIYGRAFENCTGLTSLTLPKGVTTLGGNVFAGCTKVTTLSLPATLKTVGSNAFKNVAPKTLTAAKLPGGGMTTLKITKVTIAADATSVEYKAFYGLKSMTSLTIHSKVKAIYGRAFENCTGLTSLTLPKGVTTLGGNAFTGCTKITTLSLPATLKSVSGNAFSKVAPKTLTAAKLPGGGMTTSKITKVTIAADATSVEYKAFYGLKSMTSLTIHSKVKAIYGRAFENCTGLTSLTLPKGVTTLGGNAFAGCTKITTLSLPATLTSVSSTAFKNVTPKTLTAAKLPGGGMTTSKITKVTIAADATTVAYKAFYGLKSMTSLTIHAKVKAIYGRAFEKCTGLKTLTIPASVTSISGYAFSGCTGLTSVTFMGNPPSAQATSFPAKMGYYPAANAAKWKKVIDKKGKWCNLTMRQTGAVASAPKFEEQITHVSMMSEADTEAVALLPAWICGTFEGEVLTVTADAETTEALVLTLTAEGSLLGEWSTEGIALCLTGFAEIVEATDAAITLKVTDGWTNAPATLMVKRTAKGVTVDYRATDATTYAAGVLTLAL